MLLNGISKRTWSAGHVYSLEDTDGQGHRLFEPIQENVRFTQSVRSLSWSKSLQPHGLQHARLPCPSPIPRARSNSNSSSQCCYPTIPFSVFPFSSYLQSSPASRSFPMNQFFTSGGQLDSLTSTQRFLFNTTYP